MKHVFYNLDKNKNAIPCIFETWEKFLVNKNDHIVKKEYLDNYFISTVFIGIDHSDFFDDKLKIFETMIFDKDTSDSSYEIYCDRYSTWKEAEEGHLKAIEWIKNGCKDDVD